MAALAVVMMGGGPRTFPGGITKWEWAKQQRKRRQLMERAQRQRLKDVAEERRRQKELRLALELESRSLEEIPHHFIAPNGQPTARSFPSDAIYSTQSYSRCKLEPHPILDVDPSFIQELIQDET
ncbi:uncharacterized protein LOC112340532 [Selaginella moellendorffii]|uniref:uncharacterized protein LOC112340532 n=1 Tax=Selaginella moellendorffii TaxID=88036 RepID=UPI000D1C5658|nr:uncharacterized protein LOC112340532 [Selaginella moellendorffii]|eukprot:XP_024514878.1 uncharacterized protein LOC112340532 [Selaginella moellendorffii]